MELILNQAALKLYQVEVPPAILSRLARRVKAVWPDRSRFDAIMDDFEKTHLLTP